MSSIQTLKDIKALQVFLLGYLRPIPDPEARLLELRILKSRTLNDINCQKCQVFDYLCRLRGESFAWDMATGYTQVLLRNLTPEEKSPCASDSSGTSPNPASPPLLRRVWDLLF